MKLCLAALAIALAASPNAQAVTTISTGTLTLPAVVEAPYGDGTLQYVLLGCESSQSGLTQAVIDVSAYGGKTLRLTWTSVVVDVPLLGGGDLAKYRVVDCSLPAYLLGQAFEDCATATTPCASSEKIVAVVTNDRGVGAGYKLECLNC